ncbi:MAG: CDP-diacylglycerol--serine O-phosphatidyltransferase [Ignavibacteria bacterium RBG_13_36_8]|nr:MAG: CDP-diacylglycerol--serine O-phosphatidyltransferase [Ignavibacteria bacterium RBG_13_36_8]
MIYRIKNFNLSKAIIPNSFTAMNLFCGFLSIVYANQGNIIYAVALIFIAAIFDFLDGMMARLFKTTSAFGVELDSLADLISFGAAPSYLVYKSYLFQFGWIGIIISSLLLIFGAFRLARFNIQIEDLSIKADFKGLSIPHQALTMASYIGYYYQDGRMVQPFNHFIIPLVILLSFLMVTRIRYNKIPKPNELNTKAKIIALILILTAFIITAITKGEALFYILLLLALFGVVRFIIFKLFSSSKQIGTTEETN